MKWRVPGRRTALCLVLVALCTSAWFPFEPGFEGPYLARSRAHLDDQGVLHVAEPSIVRTTAPPAWLAAAHNAGALRITLDVCAERADLTGPARILTLARDTKRANLVIGQEGANLVVRCRRAGSSLDGEPRLTVPAVFDAQTVATGTWRKISVLITSSEVAIEVDGELRAQEHFESSPFERWDGSYHLALGDEQTRSRAWQGALRDPTAIVNGETFALLADRTLQRPSSFWQVPERARRALELDRGGALWYALWHVATFLPFGWALARARHRPVGLRAQATYVVGWALLASLTLEGGKLLFAGRHPTLAHAAFDAIGAALGASIFHHQTQRRAETRT